MKSLPVFLFLDQPTTCPKCGNRTEILLEEIQLKQVIQFHRCLSKECGFEFKMEEEEKIEMNK